MPFNSSVEVEETKENLLTNENSSNTSTMLLNNTSCEAPSLMSTEQQIPFCSSPPVSAPYFPPKISTIQNPSIPAFKKLNSELNSTSETTKPFILMPQVTTLASVTSQESTIISTSQEPAISSVCSQPSNIQGLTNQPTVTPPLMNYSEYHPTNVGSTAKIANIPSSKETSNYFTQFQTQVSPSNNSSTIPMFSVKNFPQMSPLAQPLGKWYIYIIYLKHFKLNSTDFRVYYNTILMKLLHSPVVDHILEKKLSDYILEIFLNFLQNFLQFTLK